MGCNTFIWPGTSGISLTAEEELYGDVRKLTDAMDALCRGLPPRLTDDPYNHGPLIWPDILRSNLERALDVAMRGVDEEQRPHYRTLLSDFIWAAESLHARDPLAYITRVC